MEVCHWKVRVFMFMCFLNRSRLLATPTSVEPILSAIRHVTIQEHFCLRLRQPHSTAVSVQARNHAAILARFALDAVRAASDTLIDEEDPTRGSVQLRAGLHSGPCMACVVGRTHPKYTLLGDTVNTASRMESTGVPGMVQCSARTAELVLEQNPAIRLTKRGVIQVKGKGSMETWWILPDNQREDNVDIGCSDESKGGTFESSPDKSEIGAHHSCGQTAPSICMLPGLASSGANLADLGV